MGVARRRCHQEAGVGAVVEARGLAAIAGNGAPLESAGLGVGTVKVVVTGTEVAVAQRSTRMVSRSVFARRTGTALSCSEACWEARIIRAGRWTV